jgi:hypothetical protein
MNEEQKEILMLLRKEIDLSVFDGMIDDDMAVAFNEIINKVEKEYTLDGRAVVNDEVTKE